LIEVAYEAFLAHELQRRGYKADRQLALPAVFEDARADVGYRIDMVVDDRMASFGDIVRRKRVLVLRSSARVISTPSTASPLQIFSVSCDARF